MKKRIVLGLVFCGLLSINSCAGVPKNEITYFTPKMFNSAKEAGLEGAGGSMYSWTDYNNDGCPDLLVDGHVLYKNSGAPDFKFTNVTAETGLSGASGNGVWADFDNNGWLDLANCSGQLWKNENGKFTEISKDAGLKFNNPVCSIGWGDFDADGFVDLYAGTNENNAGGGFAFVPHQLLRNSGKGTFEDVSAKYGIDKKLGYGRSIIWCDYDCDGRLDLYVGNYRLRPNFLFHNNKDGSFLDVSGFTDTAGEYSPEQYTDAFLSEQEGRPIKFGPSYGHTIGACWADFNNDGYFDIWTSNLVHKYVGETGSADMPYDMRGYVCDDSKIYVNQGPPNFKFADIRDKCGVPRRPIGGRDVSMGDELWSNAVAADFDNDTFTDVFVTQIYNLPYAVTRLFRNKGNLIFEDVAGNLGIRYIDTYGAAWADYNCDGDMDLVVAGREKVDAPNEIHLFKNNGNELSWMEFRLEGTKSNRAAIGARVEVKIGELKMVRQVEGGTGAHAQQNSMTIHFGLGNFEGVNEATIYWPSGTVQKLGRLEARKIHYVMEK